MVIGNLSCNRQCLSARSTFNTIEKARELLIVPIVSNAFRQYAHGSSLSQEQGLEIPIIANAFRRVCL